MPEQFTGPVEIQTSNGTTTILMDGDDGRVAVGMNNLDGLVVVRDGGGNERIRLDASTGQVTSSDATSSGGLRVGREAYDRRVAGVVSGAGDLRPGIVLGRSPDAPPGWTDRERWRRFRPKGRYHRRPTIGSTGQTVRGIRSETTEDGECTKSA